MRWSLIGLMALTLSLTTGCGWMWWQESPQSLNASSTTPAMKAKGIIYILPGIQGMDDHYTAIRQGLRRAGVRSAIEIHLWGSQIPGVKLAVNEMGTDAGRDWGRKIAEDIYEYQRVYPGRAVHLIGQSGGSAVAIFVLEALAESGATPVTGVILLDASLSADYDLTVALGKSTQGIVNFRNSEDVAALGVGTAVMGNLDGGHGDSAGRTGFKASPLKLYEVKVTPSMVSASDASHFADTSAAFAVKYIAPWIMQRRWPVPVAVIK